MSEEELRSLTAEQVADEMLRCKLEVWSQLREIQQNMLDGLSRVDALEASLVAIKKSLKNSELQRVEYHNKVQERLERIDNWSHNHGVDEMEKYDYIIDAIKGLTAMIKETKEETDTNSKLLAIKARKEEIELEVQKRLDESHKDYHEYKKSAIKAVIVMTAMGLAGIVWNVVKAYA
jgi:hypothetical protein